MTSQLTRTTQHSVKEIKLPHGKITERFLVASALDGQSPYEMFQSLNGMLQPHACARLIRESVFGLVNSASGPTELVADGAHWPQLQVAEADKGFGTSGIHLHTIEGAKPEIIRVDGRIVGSFFEDEYARYCLLGDIHGDPKTSREEQTRAMYEMMEVALKPAGMDFSHIVRTWLYLDRILDWYDSFNKVRNQFFTERGCFGRFVPASTGVGGINPAGAAIVAEAIAVLPKDPRVKIQPLISPLQNSALDYGSSFSRAVEVSTPDHRRIYVSGSASIAPEGETVHLDDVAAQTDLSMRVVAAILESRGMDWSNVNRALAYVKYAKDAEVFTRYCEEKGIDIPVVVSEQDVCRDNLLFEIEVDAVAVNAV